MGGTLLSPSKTNEERVTRIIKDLNWQAKFDELSDNLKSIKKKQLFARQLERKVSSGINIAGMLDREKGEPVRRNVKF
jgi:hypothetical protein